LLSWNVKLSRKHSIYVSYITCCFTFCGHNYDKLLWTIITSLPM
jgi:hypothetical protein